MDTDGSNERALTGGSEWEFNPVWSPDGSSIAFQSEADGNSEIYSVDVETGEQTRVTDNEYFDGSPSWSPDGLKILFHSDRAERGRMETSRSTS